MQKIILTTWVLILGLSLLAQSPRTSHLNETNKAATAGVLPAFVVSEEVTFKGDNIVLSGTLFLPKSKAGQKVPAVVMVTDFYSQRDGVKVGSVQHNSYRDLAIHLVESGFAVLRFDRRCTGKSECNIQATMAVAADDGMGGITYLADRKEIDARKIFVLGHGDGSFIAANIAGHKGVAGLIAINPPGRNASKLLREWARQQLTDQKVPEAEARTYLKEMEDVIQRLAAGGAKPNDFQIDPKDTLLSPLVQAPDYAYSWLLDDPLALFPNVMGPVLIVHGGKDRRISPREGTFIKDSLQTGDHKDYETHVLPDLDYFLKVNKGVASFEADKDVARPLDPALLKLVDDWLLKKRN